MHPALYIFTSSVCWLMDSLYLAISLHRNALPGQQYSIAVTQTYQQYSGTFQGFCRGKKSGLWEKVVGVCNWHNRFASRSQKKHSQEMKLWRKICYSWCIECRSYFQSKGTFNHNRLCWVGAWFFLTVWYIWAKKCGNLIRVRKRIPGKKLYLQGLVGWSEPQWCGDMRML